MADISSKLDKIKSAERGEDVRDAIIGALRDINNDVPADMSNPERVTADMPGGSDLTIPFNPPKLVSEIYVRQAGSGGKSTTLKDITITENGEYPTDEEDYDSSTENRYYKKVKVDVPQLANKIEMDEVVIEQNGTYSATEWGVDGLRTITVNVQEAAGDGPFQVEFYDKQVTDPTAAVHETQLIAKGGSAATTYRPTAPTGLSFVGWDPSPVNITRDMKCYPKFASQSVVIGEIPEDWDVICANGGAGYPLGSFKSLAYGATIPGTEIHELIPTWPSETNLDVSSSGMAIKVAEGESGTNSSWIWFWFGAASLMNAPDNDWRQTGGLDYTNRYYHTFLTCLFNHMSDIFKVSIKDCLKYTQCSDRNAPPYSIKPVSDKIWVPSVKEMMGTDQETVGMSIVSAYGEETQYETNYKKYVQNVPQSIAYFKDNLVLTAMERNNLMYLLSNEAPLRDTPGGTYAVRTLVGGSTGGMYSGRAQCSFWGAEYGAPAVYPILGFCL